jgi:hypothetical protein
MRAATMLAWHVPYLGWTRLPADLTEFEITHFFFLRPEERSAVLTRYRDSLRLAAALQIGFLKTSGRPLDAVQRVPADLLKHLGEQIEVPAPSIATLRALYLKRRRTLYEHQRWAMDFLGLIRFEPTDTDKLLPALCDVVRAGVSGDQLLTATRKLLYEHRFVISGTRRLSNLVQAATSAVDHASMAVIEREIPLLMRNRWLEVLSRQTDQEHKTSLLEYLQEPPSRFAPMTIERQSDKVTRLLKLAVDRYHRFRVQLADLPSTTITSHVSKAATTTFITILNSVAALRSAKPLVCRHFLTTISLRAGEQNSTIRSATRFRLCWRGISPDHYSSFYRLRTETLQGFQR